MFKDLSQIARRGIIVELAVAIALAQFATGLISSFVSDILLPPIGLLLGHSFSSLFFNLTPGKRTPQGGPVDSLDEARYVGASIIAYGSFIEYALEFLLVLFVSLALLRWVRKLNAKPARENATEVWPPAPTIE